MAKKGAGVEDKIINAAKVLFSKKGFKNTSIDLIAKECKIDKGKLEKHFKKPMDILEKIIGNGVQELTDIFTKIINERGKSETKLSKLVTAILKHYETDFEFFKILNTYLYEAEDGEWLENDLMADHLNQHRQNTAMIGRLIAQGQSEGQFISTIDPVEASYMLRGLIRSEVKYWQDIKKRKKLTGKAENILRVFFKGIGK